MQRRFTRPSDQRFMAVDGAIFQVRNRLEDRMQGIIAHHLRQRAISPDDVWLDLPHQQANWIAHLVLLHGYSNFWPVFQQFFQNFSPAKTGPF